MPETRIKYKPDSVCAREISFIIRDNAVHDIQFEGGCSGNSKGLSRILEGMPVEDITKRLSGVTCGHKKTSCPDQLAKALLLHGKGEKGKKKK